MAQSEDEFQVVLDRLKAALRLPTNKALAEALGLTASNLGERKSRNALPLEQIEELCERSRLSKEWVYRGVGEMFAGSKAVGARLAQLKGATEAATALGLPDDQARALQELLFYVAIGDKVQVAPLVRRLQLAVAPRLHVQASAGNGAVVSVDDEAVTDYLAFDVAWLREIGCSPANVAVITVRGDSMAETLNDGDLIVVDTSPMERKTSGVFVIARDDVLLVKRLNFRLNGMVEIRSDNKAYPTETLAGSEFDRLHIVGRMVRRVVK